MGQIRQQIPIQQLNMLYSINKHFSPAFFFIFLECPMNALTISLLGEFQAIRNGQPLQGFRTRKVQALLIYLIAEPKAHQRESLMELLWPGSIRPSVE